MFFMGLFLRNGWVSIILMILGPLVLDVPTFLLRELMNEDVDARNMGDSRATALSVYSIGCDALEILFLFISAAVCDQEGNTAFLVAAVAYIIVSVLFAWNIWRSSNRTGKDAGRIE